MASFGFRGTRIELGPGESALDALDRVGIPLKSGCRSGVCGACLVRVTKGTVPADARRGIAPVLTAQGAAFACCLRPTEDLELDDLDGGLEHRARIVALETIGQDVLRMRLACEGNFDYTPGQYVVLQRDDGLERSYSLASLPGDATLELHVRRTIGGAMSSWLFDGARPGDGVGLRGPLGTCCYTPERQDGPLVLVGAGTGLAPLFGILRDALNRGHTGPIQLFHGARDTNGLYYRAELLAIASAASNVTVRGCVLEGPTPDPSVRVAPLGDAVASVFPNLAGCRVFLCGDGSLVRSLKRRFFLAGAASRDLLADPFDAAALPARKIAAGPCN